jgi:hypothetical protein
MQDGLDLDTHGAHRLMAETGIKQIKCRNIKITKMMSAKKRCLVLSELIPGLNPGREIWGRLDVMSAKHSSTLVTVTQLSHPIRQEPLGRKAFDSLHLLLLLVECLVHSQCSINLLHKCVFKRLQFEV